MSEISVYMSFNYRHHYITLKFEDNYDMCKWVDHLVKMKILPKEELKKIMNK